MGAQKVADKLPAAFVTNVHLVAAPCATQAMPCSRRSPSRGAPLFLVRMYSARLSISMSRVYS